MASALPHQATLIATTPKATTLSQSLPQSFFARPAEQVAPDLIGCLLVKRQPTGEQLWGVVVETEAYSQDDPACHGHRRRSPSNDTLFGEPGRFYVYVSYGIHHCVNMVTHRAGWANGVLLRALALPGEPERVAAGPALLARRFAIDRRDDAKPVQPDQLGAGSITPPPHPGSLPDQNGVLCISATGRHDQPIPPFLSALGAGAGLSSCGSRHHGGCRAAAPEHQVITASHHLNACLQRRGLRPLVTKPARYSSLALIA
jgi:DNA-3-methyladenine glycosylase